MPAKNIDEMINLLLVCIAQCKLDIQLMDDDDDETRVEIQAYIHGLEQALSYARQVKENSHDLA